MRCLVVVAGTKCKTPFITLIMDFHNACFYLMIKFNLSRVKKNNIFVINYFSLDLKDYGVEIEH